MNIGCHGLVWTGRFDADGIRLSTEKTKAAGFDLIEFPLMDQDLLRHGLASSALAEWDLAVSASLGLSEATDVTSADPDVVAAGEALLIRAVDVLADLGGTHFCGVIYSAHEEVHGAGHRRGRAQRHASRGRVADHAADRGVGDPANGSHRLR